MCCRYPTFNSVLVTKCRYTSRLYVIYLTIFIIHSIWLVQENLQTSDNETKPKCLCPKPRCATLWYTKATERHHDVVFEYFSCCYNGKMCVLYIIYKFGERVSYHIYEMNIYIFGTDCVYYNVAYVRLSFPLSNILTIIWFTLHIIWVLVWCIIQKPYKAHTYILILSETICLHPIHHTQ